MVVPVVVAAGICVGLLNAYVSGQSPEPRTVAKKASRLPLCPPPNTQTGGYRSAAALNRAVAKAPAGPTCRSSATIISSGANVGRGAMRVP